ncbi:TrmH family RNA methyltransferase [Gemmatimonadota bacterium]
MPIEVYSRLPRLPISVALDNLRSAFNVGAIFRSAECGRIEMLYTCGITAHPPAERVVKTAMGAAEFVPHRHVGSTLDAIGMARERGARIVALETTNVSRSLYHPWIKKPVCLLLGNEALGLGEDVLAEADEIVEIPLLGYKNSLNVSVAFGVVMFEILRQWGELEGLTDNMAD